MVIYDVTETKLHVLICKGLLYVMFAHSPL